MLLEIYTKLLSKRSPFKIFLKLPHRHCLKLHIKKPIETVLMLLQMALQKDKEHMFYIQTPHVPQKKIAPIPDCTAPSLYSVYLISFY